MFKNILAKQNQKKIQNSKKLKFGLALGLVLAVLAGGIGICDASDNDYKVGVNYHAIGSDYNSDAFIGQYHDPVVRDTVINQLQSMADDGADVIKTMIWLGRYGTEPTCPGYWWKFLFPPSDTELANLRQYVEDVGSIRAKDGHTLELNINLGWLWCAEYHKGTPDTTLGHCNLDSQEFIQKATDTFNLIIQNVADINNLDGLPVVKIFYMESEVMIGLLPHKANQEWFLETFYSSFVNSCNNVGIQPSLYFLVTDNHSTTYLDSSLSFLKNNGLYMPERIDFTCKKEYEQTSYGNWLPDIFDNVENILSSLDLPINYGVVETTHPVDANERMGVGQSFANEYLNRNNPKRTLFWTTPDGGVGHPTSTVDDDIGFPFDFDAYKIRTVCNSDNTDSTGKCSVDCWAAAGCDGKALNSCSLNLLKKCDSNCQEISSCGDGICNCGETSENCLEDCPLSFGQLCSAGSDCCSGVCNVRCCLEGCPPDGRYDGEQRDYFCGDAGQCEYTKDLDVVAPAAINGLSVDSITQTSVNLKWTSTGDDNNQYAANEYDIRYSAKGESEDFDWDSAIALSGEPIPLTAGTAQSYIVVGLNPGATYYFAIKAKDEVSNWSEISNIVLATTLNPEDKIKPDIFITRPVSEVAYYTTENLITLRGTAFDNVEVRQVSWINSLGGSGIASGSDVWTTASVSLQQGINVITVTAKDSSGNTNTDILNVTFRPESLSVALIIEPSSGIGSLMNVDFQSVVSNASTNGIDYTFWRDCASACDTIDGCKSKCGNWVHRKTGASNATYAIKDICDYTNVGNYFAKVIAENDGQFAEARAQIVVSEYVPPVADIVAPAKASGFVATAGDSKIVLQWDNPQDSDFTRVLIIRKQGSAPVSRTDGINVYEGNLEIYADNGLDNNITYYYAIYSYDNVPNYSEPVVISAQPQAVEPEPEPELALPAEALAEEGAEPISEMTIAELKAKIVEIMAQIKQLRILLSEITGQEISNIPSDFRFNNNLILSIKHPDVVYLKIILEQEIQGIFWTRSNYFGPKTWKAVKAFQNKYKQDISKIAGYQIRASGFIGPGTRAKLNKILQNYH